MGMIAGELLMLLIHYVVATVREICPLTTVICEQVMEAYKRKDQPCPSLSTAFRRVSLVPHWGKTGELALVV